MLLQILGCPVYQLDRGPAKVRTEGMCGWVTKGGHALRPKSLAFAAALREELLAAGFTWLPAAGPFVLVWQQLLVYQTINKETLLVGFPLQNT